MVFNTEDKENQDYEYKDPDINPETGKKWFESSFVKDNRRGKDLTNYLFLRQTDP